MKPILLALALAVTHAAAWTAPVPISHPSASRSALAAADEAVDVCGDDALDRRNFFGSAAAKATSLSLLVTSSSAVVGADAGVANAADAPTSYSKIYKPAPHSMDGKIVVITGESILQF